jgi:coenzyme F420-reducing hydrogenase delta subunit
VVVVHVTYEDCPCDPTVIPVECGDGSVSYVYAHHAFDEGVDRVVAIFAAVAELRQWEG